MPSGSDPHGSPGEEPAAQRVEVALDLPVPLLHAVCEQIAEVLADRISTASQSPWLTLPAAASYLGCSRERLYKLTAARAIPFRRRQNGQGLLFHRDELDAWVETAYEPAGCAP